MREIKKHPLESTDSTNNYLKNLNGGDSNYMYEVAWAEFQTAGRGQKGNSWESEPGKNLLFSILAHPEGISIQDQFVISQAISLAVTESVAQAAGPDHAGEFSVKWPNDIYWKEKKLAGILIENVLAGGKIADSIIGVGLDVNQEKFYSNAPNPVSLFNITGREHDRYALLDNILARFTEIMEQAMAGNREDIDRRYHSMLFRREGVHTYRAADDTLFQASIDHVCSNGILILDCEGEKKEFEFKQIAFVLE